ncbi:unnamed protein product [Periconia digitata]|uniref:Protein transport protein SEC9 n=1 Tax=Periconia digitata TaxID=1303443 RepID=A0A9W4UD79_9PLEO|nr:unnamed protein product [Periconia digitata]
MGMFSKKKDQGGDDDANRSALFGSRKGKSSPAGQDSNPYAKPPQDPYANAPPPYSGGNNSYRQEKSPAVTSQGGSYGRQGGGGGGGYGGSNPYGAGGGAPQRQGGYGGLGDPNDDARGQLFGNAPDRMQQRAPQGPPQSGAYGGGQGGYGAPGGYGDGPAYNDRKLTAEEEEEEEVSATKDQIRFMKQQDVSSTRNALRLAQQAEETGRDTLARLGAQGDRIHNTERNLDLAANQNRIAEEKTRELKTVNRSMFAMHVSNPFTSSSRNAERDAKVLETHRNERDQRDATRKAAWESSARQNEFNQANAAAGKGGPGRSTLADRAKFQFEADSDDDQMEDEIDSNLDALHGAAKRLNHLGRAMGQEVDTQNTHIERIIRKTDKVDDGIASNRAKLERIR